MTTTSFISYLSQPWQRWHDQPRPGCWTKGKFRAFAVVHLLYQPRLQGIFFDFLVFSCKNPLGFLKCSISIFLWRNSEILQSTLRFNYRHVRVVGKVSEVFGITLTCSVTVAFSTEHVPKERNFENQNPEIGNDDHFFLTLLFHDPLLISSFVIALKLHQTQKWILTGSGHDWSGSSPTIKNSICQAHPKTHSLAIRTVKSNDFFLRSWWLQDSSSDSSVNISAARCFGRNHGSALNLQKMWSRSSWKVQY